ncbi:MAG: hypothetical protein KDC98_22520 [Planctomycetes bacterium]|nr:hypothetical protein [Planctomycetota bacterium]
MRASFGSRVSRFQHVDLRSTGPLIMRDPTRLPVTLLTMVLLTAACSLAPTSRVYYRERDIGSQSTFEPLSSSLQYVLDSVQVESFDTADYGRDLRDVLQHLGSPGHEIEADGGWRRFINAEVFPIDGDHLDDSAAILPNVFLHCLGGGMLFRKQAEWFAAHDYPAPWLLAGVVAMSTEILGEAIEKPASANTDEIADVLLWRPLGLWLYGDDERASWIRHNLDPVDWPNQLIWDANQERWRNAGMNFVFRPSLLAGESTRFFAYTGMTNLFGLSHELPNGDTLSWGGGTATVHIEPVRLRWSAGLFYERDDSLLASLLVHGAEGYAVRANVYPGALGEPGMWWSRAGLFVGIDDDGATTVGVQWLLPIGLGG